MKLNEIEVLEEGFAQTSAQGYTKGLIRGTPAYLLLLPLYTSKSIHKALHVFQLADQVKVACYTTTTTVGGGTTRRSSHCKMWVYLAADIILREELGKAGMLLQTLREKTGKAMLRRNSNLLNFDALACKKA
jgi:hypothetical protein